VSPVLSPYRQGSKLAGLRTQALAPHRFVTSTLADAHPRVCCRVHPDPKVFFWGGGGRFEYQRSA